MTSSIVHKYRLIKDLPETLPLFPLKGVILLPRSNLPLNIFEPRYLQMTDDILAGERLIGMIQPAAGANTELTGKEIIPLRKTGCAGRVTEYQEVDDGRVLITLTGVCRFDLTEEVETEKAYRSYKVSYNKYEDDLLPGFGEGKVNRDTLLNVLRTYLNLHELDADWDSIHQSSNEFLVNTLSIISPYGPEEKQALLETIDLKNRSEVLIALAEMDIASGDDGSGSSLQ
ncbi:MAG: ATP-dependent protease [Rhodomicrobium sp.]|nr:MAG: ATP-dependent protease [Rhodomicrobium sp.]